MQYKNSRFTDRPYGDVSPSLDIGRSAIIGKNYLKNLIIAHTACIRFSENV